MWEDNTDIYSLKLHEELILFMNDSVTHSVIRVAGGWLYLLSYGDHQTTTFVPFNNEFQGKGVER